MSGFWQQGREAIQPGLNRLRGRLGPRALFFLFRRRLAVFLGVWAAVVLAMAIAAYVSQPLFRAEAEVLLGGPSVAQETVRLRSSAMGNDVAARLRPADRAAVAPCDGWLRRARSWLSEPEQPTGAGAAMARAGECLRRRVAVVHTPDTLSLTIGYSAGDAAVAARIANAYAAVYTRSRIDPDGRVSGARIISSATPPASPASAGMTAALVGGVLLGLVLGVVAALATELRFAGLTTGADVQNRLWVRHLGSVPDLASVLPGARSVLDAVVEHPQSGFTEAFRTVIRAARGSGPARAQAIAVVSSVPGEGATTVAMALARTLALGRQSVVVVDCDSRRRISRMFGVDATSPGLSDILAGDATLDDVLFDDAVSSAMVLPEATPPTDPIVLTGAAMEALAHELRQRFDIVLFAAGPLGLDVGWLAGAADAVVLVARWRSTPDTIVSAAVEWLQRHRAEVPGVILNRVDMHRQVRYTDDEASVYQRQFSKYFS